MAQSLLAVYVHLVFSTKFRDRSITDEVIDDLHAFLGGTARATGCTPLGVGGVEDHVHVLARLGKSTCVSDLVRELKTTSNAWMRPRQRDFAWQAGYAALSFAERDLPRLQEYVAGQREHHAKTSFQDELRELLTENGVAYDERYLWD